MIHKSRTVTTHNLAKQDSIPTELIATEEVPPKTKTIKSISWSPEVVFGEFTPLSLCQSSYLVSLKCAILLKKRLLFPPPQFLCISWWCDSSAVCGHKEWMKSNFWKRKTLFLSVKHFRKGGVRSGCPHHQSNLLPCPSCWHFFDHPSTAGFFRSEIDQQRYVPPITPLHIRSTTAS